MSDRDNFENWYGQVVEGLYPKREAGDLYPAVIKWLAEQPCSG